MSGSILIDGGSLETRLWGDPSDQAPTIVLLHEGLGSISLWRDFPAKLAAATGCAVFAYSRFGYGQSDPVTLPRPLRYMHDEALDVLPRVLAAAGLGRVILLGHSDGGSIALIHAGGAQNFMLRGIILIAPHLFVEDVSITSIEAARIAFETTDLRARLARHHRNPDNAFRGWNGAWLNPDFRAWRIDDYVPTIRVPVLAIQGTDDEYGTPAQLDPLVADAYCPVATHLIEGARHAPHLSHEAVVLGLVREFVGRIGALDAR